MRAVFSECRRYRYRLYRRWGPGRPLGFLMLNPSTADEELDDPTIRRCIGFAKSLGYGALQVANIFAWRATNPAELRKVADPVGPENDFHIRSWAEECETLICAWGSHGGLSGRGIEVVNLLANHRLWYLKLTKDGHPGHPLYLRADSVPVAWEAA